MTLTRLIIALFAIALSAPAEGKRKRKKEKKEKVVLEHCSDKDFRDVDTIVDVYNQLNRGSTGMVLLYKDTAVARPDGKTGEWWFEADGRGGKHHLVVWGRSMSLKTVMTNSRGQRMVNVSNWASLVNRAGFWTQSHQMNANPEERFNLQVKGKGCYGLAWIYQRPHSW